MAKAQTLPPHYKGYFALAILAVTILIFSFKDEPALTYDSHDYIDASQSMVTYFYGENGDGFAFTLRPPLYPLYLSFFIDKTAAAWWLNVVCFALSLWIIVLITHHLKWHPVWTYATILLTTLSLPWLQNHFFVWTEPVFSTILLLLIYFILRKKSLAIIIIICLVLFSVRKAGLFIIMVTCFYYLLKKEFRNFIWLGVVSSVFVIGWEIVITSFADRSPFMSNFEYLVQLDRSAFVDVVTAWVLPRKIPLAIRIGIIIVGIVAVVTIFRKRRAQFLSEEHNRLFATFLFGYCLFFLVVVGSTGYDETERYLSVIIPIFILMITSFASELQQQSERTARIFYFLFLLWGLYPLTRTINYFVL